jgi:hypothetical protein
MVRISEIILLVSVKCINTKWGAADPVRQGMGICALAIVCTYLKFEVKNKGKKLFLRTEKPEETEGSRSERSVW